MAKMLASEASWHAADQCLQTHGGLGFAGAYDIERKFRETRLHQIAPISTNLILSHVATHALGLPKSFREPPQRADAAAVATPTRRTARILARYSAMFSPQ